METVSGLTLDDSAQTLEEPAGQRCSSSKGMDVGMERSYVLEASR